VGNDAFCSASGASTLSDEAGLAGALEPPAVTTLASTREGSAAATVGSEAVTSGDAVESVDLCSPPVAPEPGAGLPLSREPGAEGLLSWPIEAASALSSELVCLLVLASCARAGWARAGCDGADAAPSLAESALDWFASSFALPSLAGSGLDCFVSSLALPSLAGSALDSFASSFDLPSFFRSLGSCRRGSLVDSLAVVELDELEVVVVALVVVEDDRSVSVVDVVCVEAVVVDVCVVVLAVVTAELVAEVVAEVVAELVEDVVEDVVVGGCGVCAAAVSPSACPDRRPIRPATTSNKRPAAARRSIKRSP
jgi:hypothetical protein